MSTILPCQELFDGRLTIIRPLYLIDSSTIKRYGEKMGFPLIESGCPTSGISKRAQIRELLSSLYRTNKKIKGNIASALQNSRGVSKVR
jgi:tRNA 2-thiocytidine biosynthesis protein TtcA